MIAARRRPRLAAIGIRGIAVLKTVHLVLLRNRAVADCDVVVAAIHSRFNMPEDEMTERIVAGISNENVNIFAHPTGRIINEREPYRVNIETLIAAAKKRRVALELNSHPDRLDLKDTHCRQAKEAGAMISINTDSHADQQLTNMRYGIATARRGWLEARNVINTHTLAGLRKFLAKQG